MATYKGLTVEINAETKNLNSALRDATSGIRDVQKGLKQVEKGLKLNPNSIQLLNKQAELLQQKIDKTTNRLKVLKTAMEQSSEADMGTEQWTQLQNDIRRAESSLKLFSSQLATVQGRISSLNPVLSSAADKLRDFGDKWEKAGQRASAIGSTLTSTLTPAIVGAGAATVAAATSIDTSLTNVRKTVDGTEQQYQALKDSAIEFSKTNAVSASQILDIQALGAQLGFSIDELDRFGQVVSGLDIATNMDAETAATELAQFANITKMSHDEIENYGAAVVGLGNNFATTESDISAMAMRIAAAGTQVGMSQADILGLATALSSLGVEAEAGGTAISTTIANIDKAVSTGGDALDAWAGSAGMKAAEFAAAWKNEPVEALGMVLSGIESFTEEGGNMSLMLDGLGVTALRQTDVMKRMAGNSDLVAEAVARSNEEWSKNTALTNEVENRNQSLASQFEMVKNRIVAIADDIGEPLAEALLDALDAAEPLFEAIETGAQTFADMDESSQQLILGLVALAAAAGPVLSIFGKIPALAKGVAGAFDTINKAGGILSFISGGLASLPAILGVVAAALAGLGIAAVVNETKQAEEQQRTYNEAMTDAASIISSAEASMDSYSSTLSDTGESAQDAVESLADLNKELGEQASEQKGTEAQLDNYVRTIEELAGKSGLTATEQARLAKAVEGYNSITGESVSITDAVNGELSESTENLRANAEAWKANAKAQAYSESASDYYKQAADAQVKLQEAQLKLNDATAEYNDIKSQMEAARGTSEYDELAQQLYEAATQMNALKGEVQTYQDVVDQANLSGDQLVMQAGILGSQLDTSIKNALVNLPTTMQEAGFNAMTALQQAISNGSVTVDQALSFLNTGIKSSLSALPVELQPMGGQIVQSLANAISAGSITVDQATQLLTSGITNTVGQLPVNLQQQGLFAVQSLANAISQGQINVDQATQILAAAASGNLASLPPELQGVGGQAVALLAQSLASGTDQVSGASDQLKNAASVEGIEVDAGNQAQAVGTEVAGAIEGGTGQVEGAASSYGPAVAGAVSDAASQAGTAAEAIPQTLAGALAAGGDAVKGSADTLVTSTIDALNQAPQQAGQAGTDTGNEFANGVAAGQGPTSTASAGVANATTAMTNNLTAAFNWGSSQGSNYASGLRSQIGAVSSAANALAAAAAAPLHHSTPDEGPLKDDDIWGVHMAQNIADGLKAGIPKVENAAMLNAQAVADYLEHTQPRKGPLSNGEWIYGYHAATNFAEGLYDGQMPVQEAAESLGEAAKDGLEDADAAMQEYIDGMIAGWEDRSDEVRESSTAFGDALWGGIYQGIMNSPWRKPGTGAVYDSMKILEEAGYDLESYEEQIKTFQEQLKDYEREAASYERKRAEVNKDGSSKWSASDQESYDKWKEEYDEWLTSYEQFQDMQSKLTASVPDMHEWESLYSLKDSVISGIDNAQQWSDALTTLFNKTGVVYTQEFVDKIVEGGDDYLKAVQQMGNMTDAEVQGMVDSITDLSLAEKQQELDQRSLYVNSLKYVQFKTPKERMIEFREQCLDVKEALYSDAGLSGAFEKTGTTIEGFTADIMSMDVSMSDFTASLQDYTSAVSNGFQQMTKYEKTGLEDWAETLRLNMAESQAWADNLEAVFAKVPESIDSEAFRKAVYEGGFSQWGQVIADMAGQSSEQIASYIDLYNQSMAQAQIDGINAFKALAPGEEMVNTLIEGINASQPNLDAQMQATSAASTAAMEATGPAWYSTGVGLAGQVAAGISSQIDAIASAAAAVVSAAISAAESSASTGVSAATASIPQASRSAMTAASQMPRVSNMRAFAATQAAPVAASSTSNTTINVSVSTRPGQTVDARSLAKEINIIQQREMRARGIR